MSKAIAVLISDVHYSLATVKLADAAMNLAIEKANELLVPLIVTGDLHDTKANIRGECIKAMLATFNQCKLKPIVITGNHDLINERSKEHSLEFLKVCCHVVDEPIHMMDRYFIPYMHDIVALKAHLKTIPAGSTILMHQGLLGSNTGEYFNDKTALNPNDDLASYRVISGHYHTRQTISLPDGGVFHYVGNPYTLTFGEANGPPKGFQILYDNNTLEFIPTNLRKHVIYELTANHSGVSYTDCINHNPGDLVYCRIRGSSDQLSKITRSEVAKALNLEHVRLDLIPIEVVVQPSQVSAQGNSSEILMDSMIDSLINTEDRRKIRLKGLWKDLIDGQEN